MIEMDKKATTILTTLAAAILLGNVALAQTAPEPQMQKQDESARTLDEGKPGPARQQEEQGTQGAGRAMPDGGRAAQAAGMDRSRSAQAAHEARDVSLLVATVPVFDVTAGELAARPRAYFGRLVSVRADVAKAYDAHSFTLDEDRIGAGPDVLVLNPEPSKAPDEGASVTVVGVVRPFVEAEMHRDYDWFESQPSYEIDFKTRPVIVASSVRNAAGGELVQSKPAARESDERAADAR